MLHLYPHFHLSLLFYSNHANSSVETKLTKKKTATVHLYSIPVELTLMNSVCWVSVTCQLASHQRPWCCLDPPRCSSVHCQPSFKDLALKSVSIWIAEWYLQTCVFSASRIPRKRDYFILLPDFYFCHLPKAISTRHAFTDPFFNEAIPTVCYSPRASKKRIIFCTFAVVSEVFT